MTVKKVKTKSLIEDGQLSNQICHGEHFWIGFYLDRFVVMCYNYNCQIKTKQNIKYNWIWSKVRPTFVPKQRPCN